jgi:uncharacterized cupredoxin-like copper-binding protein
VRRSGLLGLVGVGLSLVLLGCAGGTQASGPGVMGERGSGMMGGGSAYHYAPSTCSVPSTLAGQTVQVTLADMGMTTTMGGVAPMGAHMRLSATPSSVPAGTVTLVASNLGWRTHELVILPLANGAAAGQRVPGADGKVDETGSLGEASSSCSAGTGEGIASGAVSWTTVVLKPGRYELVCNLRNHYADGMYQELTVT